MSVRWAPSAIMEMLRQRAEIISTIRDFFRERNVLEVETPVLSHGTVTDPHVLGIPALFKAIGSDTEKKMYLQTSPEYAMKRLLAAGSGAIYQITKAFRQGEIGRLHNPEFTMLEWYRPRFDHHDLMDEMDMLLQRVLKTLPAERIRYEDIFMKYIGINPHTASAESLRACAKQQAISIEDGTLSDNAWLDLLWTHSIEPLVGQERPLFLYDFPTSQAALAKIRNEITPVASRFEVYFRGVELANGFHELQDAEEQEGRFAKDAAYRQKYGLVEMSVDERLLAALQHGLPDCSGVAMGIDRLVMIALQCKHISDVISFEFDLA